MMGYFGEFLRQHGTFPHVISTPEVAGVTYPLFYGTLLYPLLGIFTALLPANLVFRVFAVCLIALQYFSLKQLFQIATQDKFLARAVSAVVIWDIYVMTNLYSRGALSEFVAVALLQLALTWFFIGVVEPRKMTGARTAVVILALVLTAGSHTITAVYGGLFFLSTAIVVFPLIKDQIKKVWLVVATAGLLGVAALSPWIYILALFEDKLLVSGEAKRITLISGVDNLLARFAIFPLDIRTWGMPASGLTSISTPFLDAQINFPLLALAALFLFSAIKMGEGPDRRFRSLCFFGLGTFVVFLSLSVASWLWKGIPAPFHLVQFGYRLVSYCNLGLWMALLGLFLVIKSSRGKLSYNKIAISLVLILSAVCVFIKWHRADVTLSAKQDAVAPWDGNSDEARANLIHVTDYFYGFGAYSVQTPYPDAAAETATPLPHQKIPVTVSTGPQFGDFVTTDFDVADHVTALFHIQAFPWNIISLNDQVLTDGLKHYRSFFSADLHPGHYKLSYDFEPDGPWKFFYRLSWISFGALVLFTLSLTFRSARHKGN